MKLKPKNWMGHVILGLLYLVALGLIAAHFVVLYVVWTEVHWSAGALLTLLFIHVLEIKRRLKRLERQAERDALVQLSKIPLSTLLKMKGK